MNEERLVFSYIPNEVDVGEKQHDRIRTMTAKEEAERVKSAPKPGAAEPATPKCHRT